MTVQNQLEFLHRIAYRYTTDKNEINDLVQETMYKALKKRHLYKEGTNLKGWLATIMKNNFINRLRKKKREIHVGDQQDLSRMNQTVAGQADHLVLTKAINKAINDLPSNLAEPLKMCMAGYSYEEIANTFEVPIGTIKSRIFHARKNLKKHLQYDVRKRA